MAEYSELIKMLVEYGVMGAVTAYILIVVNRRLRVGDSKFDLITKRLDNIETNQKAAFKQQLAATALTTEVLLKVCESLLDTEQCVKLRQLYEACCKVDIEAMTHFQGENQ